MDGAPAAAFTAVAAMPALAADEIHVWLAQADADATPAQVRACAHGMLHALLCAHAGTASVPQLARNAQGKPYAPALPDLKFNLSHSGQRALLAFARGQAVGVDLEARPRQVQVEELAQRFFAPAEAFALMGLDATLRPAAFLRLWTHKEAVLKALGVGIGFGLERVAFGLDPNGQVRAMERIAAEAGTVAEWQLRRLAVGEGAAAALAWRGPARPVRCLLWPPGQ